MKLVEGGGSIKIAGAKIGEIILIHLVTNKVEKVMLSDVKRNGIEGFEIDLAAQPLTFYPFSAILKIKKYTEIE